jgi:hypothetical protein
MHGVATFWEIDATTETMHAECISTVADHCRHAISGLNLPFMVAQVLSLSHTVHERRLWKLCEEMQLRRRKVHLC